jgi:hypothetical protein
MADQKPKTGFTEVEELFLLAMGGGGVALVVKFWPHIVTWLIAHRVLLPRRMDPTAVLPGTGGAGLDMPRLALVAAALLIAAAVTSTVFRARRAHETEDS